MQLRIIEIIRLYQAIEAVRTREDLNRRFSYALVRAKAAIQSVYDAVSEMEKLSPAYQSYEQERIAALRHHGKRSENGELEMNGSSVVLADPGAYAAALQELQNRYSAAIQERQKIQAEVMEHVKGFEEIDLRKVPLDLFPEFLSPDLMEKLMPLVEDEAGQQGTSLGAGAAH